ncbi:MAG: SAM-dependent methyltransferase, partial [Bacilli bacterium]|nr:SAM-dependent methyltransferase [Bacilli bacterium]
MSNSLIRIKEIAGFIKPYKIIADIGCDHGYLIDVAFTSEGIEKAYAIDNKKDPLDSAINNLKNKPFFKDIVFSLSSGIKEIGDDTECVVIVGMGGMLITEILDDDLRNVKRLILEPNRDEEVVRKKIVSLGFDIVNEKIVFEKGKYYEIIVCDKVDYIPTYSEIEYEFGPLLLKEKSIYFKEK